MSAYLTTLVAISALIGVSSYISYGEKQDKYLKAATSLILVYVIITPVITLVRNAEDYQIYDFTAEDAYPSIDDTEFAESAEEAFCEGVRRYVCEEFSLSEEGVRVVVFGFDSIGMKAETIRIILSGKAALADNRGIAETVSESGLGKCEVEISVK